MRVSFNPAELKALALDLSHDELIAAIQKLYPDAVHGRDFMVAHPVAAGSTNRTGPAQILGWNLPCDPPDVDEHIAPVWDEHGASIQKSLACRDARTLRIPLLAEADVMVNKAHDSNDSEALAKAVAYRQALRDVTRQIGFPYSVQWPEKP